MPYNRRYKSNRGYKRRRPRGRNIFYRRAGNKALYLAKKAMSMLNVEKKEHNIILTDATIIDGIGAIQQLSNIAQGDTTLTRDGAQCKLVSIYIKGFLEMSASATSTTVRLMLIWDKQTNQAIYATTDLLLNATEKDSVVSPLNLNNKYRFVVLWDRLFSMSITGTQTIHFTYFKKLNIVLRYDASTTAIADLTTNSISMLRVSSEVTNVPLMTISQRLRFIDN